MANKEVKVKVSAVDAASASLKKIGVEADNLGQSGQKFKVNWQAAGAAMTVAGGAIVGGLVASAKAAGDYGGQIFDATRKTGMSAESLTALKFAAEQSGVGFDQLTGAIAKQARTADAAANGEKTAQEAYARLGVSVTDASGKMKDGNTLLLETADALKGIENPTQRSAMAMEIFGRSGSQMLPMLMEGTAGIAALEAKARSLGLTMTDEMAKAADDAGDRMEAAQASISMAWKNIGATVLPVVADVADKIAVVVGNISRWAQENPGLAKSLGTVALGVGAVMAAVGPLLIALPALKSGFELLQLVKTAGNVSTLAGALGGGKGLLGVLQGAPAVLKTAGTAVSGFGAKLAGLAAAGGPILIVTAALAALGVELYFLKKKWDEAAAAGKQAGDNFKQAMAAEDVYAAKTGTQEQVAKQRKERENARVTASDRFWGAMTGGGRTSKDIARERAAMGQAIPVAGKRAAGGPVAAGAPYLVGENGAEVFVPRVNGEIKTQKSARRIASEQRYAADAAAKAQRRAEREKYLDEHYSGREAEKASIATLTAGLFAAMGGPVARPAPSPQAMMPTGSRTVQAGAAAMAAGYSAPRKRATGNGDSIVIDLRLADGMIANVARRVLSSRDGRDIIIRTVKAQGARTVPQVAFGGYG